MYLKTNLILRKWKLILDKYTIGKVAFTLKVTKLLFLI